MPNEKTSLLLVKSPKLEHEEKGTIASSFLGVFSTMAGAGILALPHAFHMGGPVASFVILLLMAMLTYATVHYLCKSADVTDEFSYEGLSQRLFSSFGIWTVRLCTLVLLFGAVMMYMIIAMDLLTPLLDGVVSRNVIGFLFTTISIPLCIPETIYALRHTNSLVILSLTYITVVLVIETVNPNASKHYNFSLGDPIVRSAGIPKKGSSHSLLHALEGFSYLIPILGLSFNCQINAVRAYGELKVKKDMKIVTILLVFFGCLFYTSFALLGYYCFNGNPPEDVLTGFAADNTLIIGARISLALCMLFKTPITFQPFREILEMCCVRSGRTNVGVRLLLTSIFMYIGWFVAIELRTLGNVMSIVGATAGFLIAVSLPGFFLREVASGYVGDVPMNSYKLPATILIVSGLLLCIVSLDYIL